MGHNDVPRKKTYQKWVEFLKNSDNYPAGEAVQEDVQDAPDIARFEDRATTALPYSRPCHGLNRRKLQLRSTLVCAAEGACGKVWAGYGRAIKEQDSLRMAKAAVRVGYLPVWLRKVEAGS
jgi:hypothetical protein